MEKAAEGFVGSSNLGNVNINMDEENFRATDCLLSLLALKCPAPDMDVANCQSTNRRGCGF